MARLLVRAHRNRTSDDSILAMATWAPQGLAPDIINHVIGAFSAEEREQLLAARVPCRAQDDGHIQPGAVLR